MFASLLSRREVFFSNMFYLRGCTMFRLLVAALLFSASSFPSSAAYAAAGASKEKLIPDVVKLDGEEYTRYEIMYTFLKSSISNYIPGHKGILDDAQIPPLRAKEDTDDALQTPEGYRVQYPWLYEFMYREEGMPRYAAINKWDVSKPVRVTMGFPNGLKPYKLLRLPMKRETQTASDELGQSSDLLVSSTLTELSVQQQNADKKSAQIVEDVARAFLPALAGATGLSLLYEGEIDKPENVPRIHIVLTTEDDSNPFKRAGRLTMISGGGFNSPRHRAHLFRGQVESLLKTAIYFTPYAKKQVDGYYLPNAANKIGLAFCFIWQGHPPEMLKALTRECLVRSMGLPDATALQSRGYLDLWGDAPELPRRSKEPIIDTVKVGETDVPTEMSDYDRLFLRLLYRPEVKPGMGAVEVYRVLMQE
ncbi:MAG TPA: hypothetical protein PLX33_12600 [Alphaproteobacteria bacterium]|nr:hypothetical protein [Alphaproteobacteria bacterium]